MLSYNDPISGSNRIKRRTLKQQIAEKLSSMIYCGLVREGPFMPSERDLMATFKVSRETIRGSLDILAARKMVEINHGARTRIIGDEHSYRNYLSKYCGATSFDKANLPEARKMVEIELLRKAAIHIGKPALLRLNDLLANQAKLLGDPVGFQIADREFHHVIHKSGKNNLLSDYADKVYDFSLKHRNVAAQEKKSLETSYREHVDIVSALENRDPEAAERAICGHLDSFYSTTTQVDV